MARKPESSLIEAIHDKLNPAIYREKMNNPYRGGTPDIYYEGPGGVLWVEYKYSETLPPVIDLLNPTAPAKLSKLQHRWLMRAYEHGIPQGVIYGWGVGRERRAAFLTGLSWKRSWKRASFLRLGLPPTLVAAAIEQEVTRL